MVDIRALEQEIKAPGEMERREAEERETAAAREKNPLLVRIYHAR
jgi:hypothetical protein